jgi:CheY-like chemotaxis protein
LSVRCWIFSNIKDERQSIVDNQKPEVEARKPFGLLLCDDMIFTSRITGTARDLGLTIKPMRTSDAVLAAATQQCPSCAILDLSNSTLDIAVLMSRLRETCASMPFVVGYGSHVDTANLQKARDAGCDIVWPRSRFVEELPKQMPAWFSQAHRVHGGG